MDGKFEWKISYNSCGMIYRSNSVDSSGFNNGNFETAMHEPTTQEPITLEKQGLDSFRVC